MPKVDGRQLTVHLLSTVDRSTDFNSNNAHVLSTVDRSTVDSPENANELSTVEGPHLTIDSPENANELSTVDRSTVDNSYNAYVLSLTCMYASIDH